MAIVKMKRLRLLALASDREDLLQRLLNAGCVEVTEPEAELNDPAWAELVKREHAALSRVKGEASAVQNALEALKKYAPVKSGLFIIRRDVEALDFFDARQRAEVINKAAQINEYNRQISQLLAQTNRLVSARQGLLPWAPLDLDLSLSGTDFTRVVLGVCPATVELPELTAALAEAAPASLYFVASSDREQHYLLLFCHREEEEPALAALRQFAFNPQTFKDTQGTAAENIAEIDRQLADLEAQRAELAERIAAAAPARESLQTCVDQMALEIAKEEAHGRLLTTGSLIFLKGWVPQPEAERLQGELADLACALELADPEEEEKPPTLLRNSRLIHSMQMVTEMYSLPSYRGIDPNPLIFPFFTIFFGMMFADVAYGLILIIASQIIIRKYKPKGTFGNIMQLATICGVTAAIWGALSGGVFGDAYTVFMETFRGKPGLELIPALIRPMEDPMSVLMLAVVMGVIQLLTGQCIHIYMGFRDKTPLDAILDVVPWWVLFAGIALLATGHGAVMIWAGVAALVLTQGRHRKGIVGKLFGGIASLYDVTSWLGDVLSYTRLMALMLAGGVIASVMNILGSLPGNIIAFFIVFVIGHTFNIGINIIGTFVHAARLQYLEFFSKFYQDGGVPFTPLHYYNTKYVNIIAPKEVGQNG